MKKQLILFCAVLLALCLLLPFCADLYFPPESVSAMLR